VSFGCRKKSGNDPTSLFQRRLSPDFYPAARVNLPTWLVVLAM